MTLKDFEEILLEWRTKKVGNLHDMVRERLRAEEAQNKALFKEAVEHAREQPLQVFRQPQDSAVLVAKIQAAVDVLRLDNLQDELYKAADDFLREQFAVTEAEHEIAIGLVTPDGRPPIEEVTL